MNMTFAQAAKYHFQFLENEFGFSLMVAKESPRGEPWEGLVTYATDATRIDLTCTRGEQPSLRLGRSRDNKKYFLPLQVIYEHVMLSEDEKHIVRFSEQEHEVARIIRKTQILSPIPASGSVVERIELQLSVYAKFVREHAQRFLKGDFSQWPAVWEYHINRLTAENVRAGRPTTIPLVKTGEDGKNYVVGTQHVFQQALDYINALREEYQDR